MNLKENYYKYANLLLKSGLCINENQPLVINAPICAIDFVRVLTEVACQIGIKDIYYDWYDDYLEHTELTYYEEEDIKKSLFWNKEKHSEYAKKDAAFLFLVSTNNNIMKDIDPEKMKIASNHSLNTRKTYRIMQENNEIDWCIAAVATKEWAKMIFGEIKDGYTKLWDLIFKICMIDTNDANLMWQKKMNENKILCDKLTNLKIESLHYKNSLGTNLTIYLSDKAKWCGGSSLIKGREIIVNMPTEEVFTTPNKYKTEGIVYCSKPLIHSGIVINDIMLEFKNGKIINYNASSGIEELRNIITMDNDSNMLGEVALVDYNSRISETGVLFYETLFDENASCHIALGRGFKECIENGDKYKENELLEIGYNTSKNHVDIMIGTKDLEIKAITYDKKEITIFKNGNFSI